MCNEYARQLHGRNAQIILGKNLNMPVEFVIAWTMAETSGGTKIGLSIAKQRNIPTFNLAKHEEAMRLSDFLIG